jgi:hypothetical protein
VWPCRIPSRPLAKDRLATCKISLFGDGAAKVSMLIVFQSTVAEQRIGEKWPPG